MFSCPAGSRKAIKAVLLSRGIEFPLTYDIEELLEIAENTGMALPGDVADAGHLTPYAVETRYPGYWHEISRDELKEAMRLAKSTVERADELLGGSGTSP